MTPGDILIHFGSGAPVEIIATVAGMTRIEFVAGPFARRRSVYQTDEIGRYFTRAYFHPKHVRDMPCVVRTAA